MIFSSLKLAMKVWKETVFDLVQENLTQAILCLIEANRNGEPPSRELLKEALESYSKYILASCLPALGSFYYVCSLSSPTRLHIAKSRRR